MRDEVNTEKVKLELYIINNEQYTDYDIGDVLYKSTSDDEAYTNSEVLDDAYEACRDIAEKLYKTITGEYKCIVEIELEYIYSYYYFDGWDLDLVWDYELISVEETDYWKEN